MGSSQHIHIVTGAFGFTGKYTAARLIARGLKVRTITNSFDRPDPFDGKVKAFPYHFDEPDKLVKSLEGGEVLYNTYWVRFNYRTFSFASALRNSIILFESAKRAGVRRIVHTSITNPSKDSPYEYFRGKAKVEQALGESGIPHAILRPALFFGTEGILINNIAWMLRRFPLFGVFGDGTYRLRPIYVDDFAKLAVEAGERSENEIVDAVGPETFTFRGLVEELAKIIGRKRQVISVPPLIGYLGARVLGEIVNDVVVTRDKIHGLMDELLYVDSPSQGETKLTSWAQKHAHTLGRTYQSELRLRR